MSPRALPQAVSLKALRIFVSVTLERILFSLKRRSVRAAGCWLILGGVHLSLLDTLLNDSLLRLSQNFYPREQLKIDLCYHPTLTFCGIAMDGD